MNAARAEQYYNEVRATNKAIWDGLNALLSLQLEWNAEDYGNTLPNGQAGGPNEGRTKAMAGAVVFATANALKAVLDAGSATNMANLL